MPVVPPRRIDTPVGTMVLPRERGVPAVVGDVDAIAAGNDKPMTEAELEKLFLALA